MNKSFSELLNNNSKSIKNESIFNNENPNGYFSKEELVSHLDTLSANPKTAWQIKHLNIMFESFKAGAMINGAPQHVVIDGTPCTWITFKLGRSVRALRIIHFGNLKQLIDDYTMAATTITDTLENLYNEAIAA